MENEVIENVAAETPQTEISEQTSTTTQENPPIQSTLDISDEEFEKWYENEISGYNDLEYTAPQSELAPENLDTEKSQEEITYQRETDIDGNEIPESNEELYEIKANGIVQQYTLEELKKLAPKAIDYTKKMQEIAPYRKINNAMKEHGITADDINQLIDIKKGDISAKRDFLSKYKLNEIEQQYNEYGEPIQDNSQYSPNQYGRETTPVDDVISELKRHPNFNSLAVVVSEFDKDSKFEISKDPNILRSLMTDIDSRIFYSIDAEIRKQNDLNPNDNRSYLQKYIDYAPIVTNRLRAMQARLQNQQNPEMVQRRKAAGLTGNKNVTAPLGNKPLPKSTAEISEADLDAYLTSLGLPI